MLAGMRAQGTSARRGVIRPGVLRRGVRRRGAWPWLFAFCSGCRCSAEPSAPSPSGAEALSCQRGSAQLTLSPGGAAPALMEPADDPGVELPFSIEPGVAIGVSSTFFATALRHESRGAIALLGRIGMEDPAVEVIELGRVRGDVAPPRLASDGEDVIVALQRATAGGHDVQVARLRGGALSAPLDWKSAPHQASDESSGFDLGAHAGQALIVWDDWVAAANHGRVVSATVPLDAAPTSVEARAVSAAGVDAESPRVTSRPDGYWLAWLVNPAVGAGRPRVYDPGGGERDDVAPKALASGPRWVEVLQLDAGGRPRGSPRRLTPMDERVVGYDLTAGGDGSAWLSWRQDAPSSSAAGGRIFMAQLRPDGTEDVITVREEDVGAGEPTLLPVGAAASPWLTFPDAQDRTLLLRLDASRVLAGPLRLGSEIEGAAALAAIGERILFAQPRGRSIELFPAACTLPAAPKGGRPSDAGIPSGSSGRGPKTLPFQ